MSLSQEQHRLLKLIDFVWNMPRTAQDPMKLERLWRDARSYIQHRTGIGAEPDNLLSHSNLFSYTTPRNPTLEITEISKVHATFVQAMVSVRVLILVFVACVGTVFLVSTDSYADLLMNAVALAFVLELPAFLYHVLIPDFEKRELHDAPPIAFPSSLRRLLNSMFGPLSQHFWGLFIFPLIAVVTVWWNTRFNILPTLEALECACYQSGPRCAASTHLNKEWWDEYWNSNFNLIFSGFASTLVPSRRG